MTSLACSPASHATHARISVPACVPQPPPGQRAVQELVREAVAGAGAAAGVGPRAYVELVRRLALHCLVVLSLYSSLARYCGFLTPPCKSSTAWRESGHRCEAGAGWVTKLTDRALKGHHWTSRLCDAIRVGEHQCVR